MIYHTHTDTTCRHIDRGYFRDSNINQIYEGCQNENELLWSMYGDKGFDSHSCTDAAYSGVYVTEEQTHYNHIMKTARISEEREFGTVKARCPLICIKARMHVLKSPVLRVIHFPTNRHDM